MAVDRPGPVGDNPNLYTASMPLPSGASAANLRFIVQDGERRRPCDPRRQPRGQPGLRRVDGQLAGDDHRRSRPDADERRIRDDRLGRATLTSNGYPVIEGKQITFTIDGNQAFGTTNASGHATGRRTTGRHPRATTSCRLFAATKRTSQAARPHFTVTQVLTSLSPFTPQLSVVTPVGSGMSTTLTAIGGRCRSRRSCSR